MKKFWQSLFMVILGMTLMISVSPTAFAQEKKAAAKAEFTLEEIVVTAERRETSAQDTPIAVSAWDADLIDEQIMEGFVDMQMRMPSTYVSAGSVAIRGVGRTSGALGTDPGVGIFKDGFYNQEGLSYLADLYDVERIENVRGPQSTLYGRATIGGAINIITKKPTKEWSGQVKATIGNYEKRDFHTAFGGPIGLIDNVYYRIRLSDIYYGGDEESVLYDDEWHGMRDRWYVDMKLLFEPTDNLSFLVTYSIFDQKDRPGATNIRDEWPMQGVDWPYPGVQWAQPAFPGSRYGNNFYYWSTDAANYPGLPASNPGLQDPYKAAEDYFGHTGEDKKEGSLTASWDVGNFTLMYLTNYRDYDYKSLSDFDDGPMPLSYGSKRYKLITTTYEWSGELQAIYGADDIPFSVIGGLYYFDRHRRMPGKSLYYGSLYEDPPIGPIHDPENAVHITDADIWDISQAAYAQVDYDFLDKWTATVGLRYAEDKKKGNEWMVYQYTPNYVILYVPEGQEKTYAPYLYDGVDDPAVISLRSLPQHQGDWSEWLYKVGLDYKPVDGSLIYGKYEHGFKPGGFTLGGFVFENFDAELVDAYEVGWKQLWMSDRFSTTIAAYLYDYEGLQMSFWNEEQNTSYITNATTADIHGVEVEVSGYIIENFLAGISYSYLSAEFGEYPGQVDTAHQRAPDDIVTPTDTRRPHNPGAVYDRRDPVTNPTGRNAWIENLKGHTMPYSPENKISVNATYTIPTDIGDFSVNALYMWQDEIFTDAFNTFDQVAPAYDRMDGQIMWNSPAYTWRVILWGKNLMDESDIIGQSTGQGSQGYPITATYLPSVTYGIDISFKW